MTELVCLAGSLYMLAADVGFEGYVAGLVLAMIALGTALILKGDPE
jgi:hypothetical protein